MLLVEVKPPALIARTCLPALDTIRQLRKPAGNWRYRHAICNKNLNMPNTNHQRFVRLCQTAGTLATCGASQIFPIQHKCVSPNGAADYFPGAFG
jgi:hypothetical protein